MEQLQMELHKYNPLVKRFQQHVDQTRATKDIPAYNLVLLHNSGREAMANPKRYNKPSVNEIAGILPTSNYPQANRDVVIKYKKGTINIFELNQFFVCFIYNFQAMSSILMTKTGFMTS